MRSSSLDGFRTCPTTAVGGDGGSNVNWAIYVVAFTRNGSGSGGEGERLGARSADDAMYSTIDAGFGSLISNSGFLFRDNVWNMDSLTARLRPGEGSTGGALPKAPGFALGMAWKTVWPKLKD